MIDISKIKPGDKVTLVPLEVWGTDDRAGLIFVNDNDGSACFRITDIAAHHPAPREFRVGDRVRATGIQGTIEHVAHGKAWVVREDNLDGIWLLSGLTLVEGGE